MIQDYLQIKKEKWLAIVKQFCSEKQLESQLTNYLVTGGKWHRPTLAEISYRLTGGKESEKSGKAYASLELIHRYLLVHDDIIDQDLVRHGSPTLEQFYRDEFKRKFPNKKDLTFSTGMAMIAGDVINALAFELINSAELNSEILTAANKALSQLLVETAAGWKIQTEQNFKKISEVSEAEFIRGMELVSAQYSFVWPLRIGRILAGQEGNNENEKYLDGYGYHTGIAFQVRDDYLGMFGEEEQTGKPVGHDYREGKKTLFILKAYEKANEEERNFLEQTLGNNPTEDQIKQAKEIIVKTGAKDEVLELGKDHVTQAKADLEKVTTEDKNAIELLVELADLSINRLY